MACQGFRQKIFDPLNPFQMIVYLCFCDMIPGPIFIHLSSDPDGIRTHDLHRDRVTSTPLLYRAMRAVLHHAQDGDARRTRQP